MVNYDLFIQIVFAIWTLGGIAYICVGAITEDMKQKIAFILAGLFFLAVCIACMVL